MVHQESSDTAPVRAVDVIDAQRRLRSMMYYPLEIGWKMDDLVRLVDALQISDEQGGDPVGLAPRRTR